MKLRKVGDPAFASVQPQEPLVGTALDIAAEHFQQSSKKTEAFFAGVIKESEIMLEWVAEQETEITTTVIDLEFLPTDKNVDRGVQNLEFCCSRWTQHSWLSRVMKRYHCRQLAEDPISSMAETAEAI